MRTLKKLLKKLYYIGTVYADEVPNEWTKPTIDISRGDGGIKFLVHCGGLYNFKSCKTK